MCFAPRVRGALSAVGQVSARENEGLMGPQSQEVAS